VISLLAIVWDPVITGYLAVGIGVAVLMGSVYMLLATNMGTRLGFMVALCGLAGWMFLMGIIWWVYGIGLIGDAPAWRPIEVTTNPAVSQVENVRALADLPMSAAAPGGWELLGDDASGDLNAAADAEVVCGGTDERNLLAVNNCLVELASDLEHHRVFEIGGERYRPLGIPDNAFTQFFIPSRGRPHHAVVQVQQFADVVPIDLNSDAPIADRVVDTSAPIYSVVLVRDQGNLRFPPFLVTIGSGLVFFLTAYQLHRRDLELMAREEDS